MKKRRGLRRNRVHTKENTPMGGNGMTSPLYFLAFGRFFYWMMKRSGCGIHAHGGHGGHDHAGHRHDAPALLTRAGG